MKKRLISLLAAILLVALPMLPAAMAEDCFTIDVDTLNMDRLNSDEYVAANLSASAQGVRVTKYISDSSELAAPVRLTLTQMDSQTLVFDKDYGYQGGMFDSGVIYLPYAGDHTVPYLVTLYVGDFVFAMPYMQLQPRLQYNGACTYGARLRDLDSMLTSDWMMGTMVDLNALRAQGMMTVDICASNSYIIGQATINMSGEQLCVGLSFLQSANVEVNSLSLYVATDCTLFTTADTQRLPLPAYTVGDWVDVSGAGSALIYMPMYVSYDPAGLYGFGYDAGSREIESQISLWQSNRAGSNWTETTPGGAAGVEDGYTPWTGGGGWVQPPEDWQENPGWEAPMDGPESNGWTDNSGWVEIPADGTENNGWTDNSGWVESPFDGTENGGWMDNYGWVEAPIDGPESNGWGYNSGWIEAPAGGGENSGW